MTTEEMSLVFDIQYDNLKSHQAGNVEPYEKSVFLTKAEHVIEEQLYAQMDQTENVRQKLSKLISTISIPSTDSTTQYNRMEFTLPSNLRAIIHEELRYNDNQDCMSNVIAEVRPVTYDNVAKMRDNPFIFTDNRALRLDGSKGTDKLSLLLVKGRGVFDYVIDYIRVARPIFVEGCVVGDTLDGIQYDPLVDYQCELEETVHSAIVDLAVQMAGEYYKS